MGRRYRLGRRGVFYLLGADRRDIFPTVCPVHGADGRSGGGYDRSDKYTVDAPRPWTVLAEAGIGDFPRVQGYDCAVTPSFPSGHTATAFALFTGISLFVRNRRIKVGMFFPALAVAFSRIYLMQHFLSDVLVGSLIGVAAALVVYIGLGRTENG